MQRKLASGVSTFVGLVVALALGTGCTTARTFYDDFDADSVGSPPNTSPPGDPSGDEIYIAGGNNAPGMLTVVNSPEFGSKGVRYSNVDVPVFYRYVGFISANSTIDERFWAVWTGNIDLSPSGSYLEVWLGDAHFLALAGIRFDDGRVLLRTSTGATPSYEDLGAYIENVNHVIIFAVNKTTSEYTFTLTQPGGAVVSSGSRSVLNPAALAATRPSAYLWYGENLSGTGRYLLDEVLITKEEPGS